jgi:arginine decarboxylase-like protein
LSPLLFVLGMEALSQMLSATVESGRLFGFFVNSRYQEAMIVFHLLFADHTLIFCDPNVEQF